MSASLVDALRGEGGAFRLFLVLFVFKLADVVCTDVAVGVSCGSGKVVSSSGGCVSCELVSAVVVKAVVCLCVKSSVEAPLIWSECGVGSLLAECAVHSVESVGA